MLTCFLKSSFLKPFELSDTTETKQNNFLNASKCPLLKKFSGKSLEVLPQGKN